MGAVNLNTVIASVFYAYCRGNKLIFQMLNFGNGQFMRNNAKFKLNRRRRNRFQIFCGPGFVRTHRPAFMHYLNPDFYIRGHFAHAFSHPGQQGNVFIIIDSGHGLGTPS